MDDRIKEWRWRVQRIVKNDGTYMRLYEFAAECGWSPAKLSRKMTGRHGTKTSEEEVLFVENLLQKFGV